eukprot:gb/GECH01013939.1/.p1 GENE.gb/GECH01013939.1/~~gb/GECH01013939.1/.p1  ORF type:complete len:193 (+),score=33.56 gb/GECH01013939.1/:1-579(+)
MSDPVVVKIGMLGDQKVGKTSLMVKYVDGTFDEDYVVTLGVNFMEKKINIKNNAINFMIWDLGGQKEFMDMLPLVCNEAVVLFFMFDLTRKATLSSMKDWYMQARSFNKSAVPFLIGTKYDLFVQELSAEEQENITQQARRYAKSMKAPLVFCSAKASVNIHKIFKLVLTKVFDLPETVQKITNVGEPIIEY